VPWSVLYTLGPLVPYGDAGPQTQADFLTGLHQWARLTSKLAAQGGRTAP
jgi:hypothetical protein